MTGRTTAGRRRGWGLALLGLAGLAGASAWILLGERVDGRALFRLAADREALRAHLAASGATGAPFVFIAIQAAQVLVAPIPGDVTGLLGGFVFGPGRGFVYSTIGLTMGSLAAFGLGRSLGVAAVRRFVSPEVWRRLGFAIEADGALLCGVLYLLPGVPKDVLCYLFGVSPVPFRVFALVSTVARMPGTWLLSVQGAHAADGRYVELGVVAAAVGAVALLVARSGDRLIARLQGRAGQPARGAPPR